MDISKGGKQSSRGVMGLQASAKRPDHGIRGRRPYMTIHFTIGNNEQGDSFTRRRTAVERSGDLGWYSLRRWEVLPPKV